MPRVNEIFTGIPITLTNQQGIKKQLDESRNSEAHYDTKIYIHIWRDTRISN